MSAKCRVLRAARGSSPAKRTKKKCEEVVGGSVVAGGQAAGRAFLDSDCAKAADDSTSHRRAPLDLRRALSRCAILDGHYIVVDNVPAPARLSAGRCNGDGSWSLTPSEIDGVVVLVPSGREASFTLTVRLLVPDAYGYEYASTAAKVDIEVTPALWSTNRTLDRASEVVGSRQGPPVANDNDTSREERRLAAAMEEWLAEEAARLARVTARWEAAEAERWVAREAELAARHAADLSRQEQHWRRYAAEWVAQVEAQCGARSATAEARWRAEVARSAAQTETRQAAAARRSRHRRFFGGFAGLTGAGLLAMAVWML
jgi:hypothetical protein